MSYTKQQCKEYLRRIERHLIDNYGIEVLYDQYFKDAYYDSARCIEINSRQNYPSRLHSLLHEAGHVVIRKQTVKPFFERFPYQKIGGADIRGNKKHRVDIIREEVMAWERAEDIAAELCIELDLKIWSRHRSSALLTYMEWFK